MWRVRRNEALGYLALIKRGKKNLARGKLHYFKGGACSDGRNLNFKGNFFLMKSQHHWVFFKRSYISCCLRIDQVFHPLFIDRQKIINFKDVSILLNLIRARQGKCLAREHPRN